MEPQDVSQDVSQEPEDLVSQSKYLLELIQMDLNFGRTETILARAIGARKLIDELTKLYSPAKEDVTVEDMETYLFSEKWVSNPPDDVGLYMIVSEGANWVYDHVAITERMGELFVHCEELPKPRRLRLYSKEMGKIFWKFVA